MEEQKQKYPWEIVEDLRIKSGIPKKVLAEKLQINYSYLVDLLNGRYPSKIDNDKLRTISELFQISIQELMNLIHQEGEDPDSAQPAQGGPAEVMARIGAPTNLPVFPMASGIPLNSLFGNAEWRQTQAPENIPAVPGLTDPETFGIRLQDDSLYPPCPDGSLFIISPQKHPRIGDVVLITLSDHRTWLAELNRIENETAILRPYNPKFDPISVMEKDVLWIYPVVWIKIN